MKLNDLVIPTTTRMEVLSQYDEAPTGVFITGHTPDSKEWRQAQRAIANPNANTSIELGKKGANKIQIPNDPKAYEKRIRLLASVVTNIEGLDDFQFSQSAVLDIFMNDGCAYIVDQWETHMEDRKAFLEPPEKTAKRGPKS